VRARVIGCSGVGLIANFDDKVLKTKEAEKPRLSL